MTTKESIIIIVRFINFRPIRSRLLYCVLRSIFTSVSFKFLLVFSDVRWKVILSQILEREFESSYKCYNIVQFEKKKFLEGLKFQSFLNELFVQAPDITVCFSNTGGLVMSISSNSLFPPLPVITTCRR